MTASMLDTAEAAGCLSLPPMVSGGCMWWHYQKHCTYYCEDGYHTTTKHQNCANHFYHFLSSIYSSIINGFRTNVNNFLDYFVITRRLFITY